MSHSDSSGGSAPEYRTMRVPAETFAALERLFEEVCRTGTSSFSPESQAYLEGLFARGALRRQTTLASVMAMAVECFARTRGYGPTGADGGGKDSNG